MIKCLRSQDGGSVVIRIEAGDLGTLQFCRSSGSTIEAILLQRHIEHLIGEAMQEIRRTSYNRGWRDAKSKKKAKDTFFPTHPAVLEWERGK